MSSSLPLVVGLTLLAAAEVPAVDEPAWCGEARALLVAAPMTGPDAWPRYLAVVEKLPREADAVVEDARRRAGESGTLSETFAALSLALADGCRPPSTPLDARSLAAEVQALVESDERFAGERAQRDVVDEWKARLAAWLERVFESQLMRSYAGASRVVYLTVLALVVLLVAVRLWRARARPSLSSRASEEQARIERERRRAFAEWRAEATACFDDGDLRGALRAAQLALLARIGEVDEGAVTPARTNREVLRRLDDERRAVVAPVLSAFEPLFYGGAALERAVVERFLVDVDGAARALEGTTS